MLSGGALGLASTAVSPLILLVPLFAYPLFDDRNPFRARVHLVASALIGFSLPWLAWRLGHA
ncbi:MAG TPA: hypothetical protein VIA45_11695 [Thermoanaerobaculia bacterium]